MARSAGFSPRAKVAATKVVWMSAYLFENPWPLFVILLATGLLLAWIYSRQSENRFLYAAAACFVLMLLPFGLDWLVESPREQIQATLNRLASAAEQGDAETIVNTLSPQYQTLSMDRAGMAMVIRQELARLKLTSVSLNGVQIDAAQGAGTAKFVAILKGTYHGQPIPHYPLRFELAFRQTVDGWKIEKVRRFDVVGSQEIGLQDR